MQGRRVEQQLQRVVGVHHRGVRRLGPVVPQAQGLVERAEPVGLVVDDEVAVAGRTVGDAQHRVDRAREVAAQRRSPTRIRRRAGRRTARTGRPAAGARAAGSRPRGSSGTTRRPRMSPPASGSSKSSSARRSPGAMSASERSCASGPSGVRSAGSRASARSGALAAAHWAASSPDEVRCGGVHQLEHPVGERAEQRARRQVGHGGRASRAARPPARAGTSRRTGRRRGPARPATPGRLRLGADALRVVRGGRQRRVRGAAPGDVRSAAERRGVQLGGLPTGPAPTAPARERGRHQLELERVARRATAAPPSSSRRWWT